MVISSFESLTITNSEFDKIKNGELGKFFGFGNPLTKALEEHIELGEESLGWSERNEESCCFNENLWVDRNTIFKVLLPTYYFINFTKLPLHLRQALPSYLYSWIYAVLWRQKIPKGFFSKNKEALGDTFLMLNSPKTVQREKAVKALLSEDYRCLVPDYIISELIKLNPNNEKIYIWSNRVENFMKFRLIEKEFLVFKGLATPSNIFSNTLLKLLEKDLIEWGVFSKEKSSISLKSIERFRKHNPETGLRRKYGRPLNKKMLSDSQNIADISYADTKKASRGRPSK